LTNITAAVDPCQEEIDLEVDASMRQIIGPDWKAVIAAEKAAEAEEAKVIAHQAELGASLEERMEAMIASYAPAPPALTAEVVVSPTPEPKTAPPLVAEPIAHTQAPAAGKAPVAKEPELITPTPERLEDVTAPIKKSSQPKGQVISIELMQSDAFRALSRASVDILMFVLSRRQYPAKDRDYHHPLNESEIRIQYETIKTFFGTGKKNPPDKDTVNQAIKSLLGVGFIALVHQGGRGKGDCSIYCLIEDWRKWREGDGPVSSKGIKSQGFAKRS